MYMFELRCSFLAFLAIAMAACSEAAPPEPKRFTRVDIPGNYELVERDMADGRILKRTDAAGFISFTPDHQNLNLFIRNPGGKLASESSIIRYTLDDRQYCEWIEYTTRKDLDAPGVTNTAPAVTDHCTPINQVGDTVVFAPPGESVSTTWSKDGFTAVIPGQFTDHWRKVKSK